MCAQCAPGCCECVQAGPKCVQLLFVYEHDIIFLHITNSTSECKLGFVQRGVGLFQGQTAPHIKVLVIPRVVVYCIGKDQL